MNIHLRKQIIIVSTCYVQYLQYIVICHYYLSQVFDYRFIVHKYKGNFASIDVLYWEPCQGKKKNY